MVELLEDANLLEDEVHLLLELRGLHLAQLDLLHRREGARLTIERLEHLAEGALAQQVAHLQVAHHLVPRLLTILARHQIIDVPEAHRFRFRNLLVHAARVLAGSVRITELPVRCGRLTGTLVAVVVPLQLLARLFGGEVGEQLFLHPREGVARAGVGRRRVRAAGTLLLQHAEQIGVGRSPGARRGHRRRGRSARHVDAVQR
mmetsp:Transcript_7423/g.22853  ORF Transcript_7423/g.22853 Transcript_7423/m.22853 type:complete len:203 (-) Transcript_7423:1964-2572(-)